MSVVASPPPTLHGAGLVLRPLDPEEDAPVLHAIFGDTDQLRFMLMPPRARVDDTRALLRRWGEDVASPQWLIVENQVPCGRITLVRQRLGVDEIGVQVLPAAQGRGVATRAIVLVTEHAFAAREACRVFGDVDPGNLACRAAFRRAGFRLEATLLANWKTAEGVFDSEIYAATAGWRPPPWPAGGR